MLRKRQSVSIDDALTGRPDRRRVATIIGLRIVLDHHVVRLIEELDGDNIVPRRTAYRLPKECHVRRTSDHIGRLDANQSERITEDDGSW